MSLKKIRKEYRETPKQEIVQAAIENATYGFLASVIVVFIANRIDIAVLIGYMVYYFYVGKVINRPKYVTSLGKFIMFPVPAALGAFIGYKIGFFNSIKLYLTILFLQKVCGFDSGIDIVIEVVSHFFPTNKNK